jgi:hypothetical protein
MNPVSPRWIVTGLLATTLLAVATPAFAESRRYKGVQAAPQRVIVRERSSSAAPVIAGLIGGFILGSAIASSADHVVVHEDRYDGPYHRPIRYTGPTYRYYDPYGDDWYDSLDECRFHSRGPQVVFVIDVRNGHRVREMQFRHGRWNHRHHGFFASWAHGRGYRYNDRRWQDDDRRYRWNDERRDRGDRDREDRDGDRRYRERDRGND